MPMATAVTRSPVDGAAADADGGGGYGVEAPPLELLRACYEAFAERRLRRGARSLRTRQGYEQLRGKYQPRLRLLQDAHASELAREAEQAKEETTVEMRATEEKKETDEEREAYARYSDEEDDDDGDGARVAAIPAATMTVTALPMAQQPPSSDVAEFDSEASALQQIIGVFFDARVKRFVLETVWPLAHHGGSKANDALGEVSVKTKAVPEWQELEEHKYFAFMFKALVWLFPGLPAFEAQELTEWDWSKDCEFDSFGTFGLSFEGFMVSMLDLALACTDGSAAKCTEFFMHLTKRLEMSLPIFRVPTTTALPTPSDDDAETRIINWYEQIVWKTIPLEKLYPCPVRVRPQFLEFKAKLSAAPVILMVLAGNERPLELQLSTSAKLLVRERDHRSSVRRNTMHSNALSHFIEIEKQFLWTYRSFPAEPTLVIIPSGLVSKRTLTLYGCCRLLETHEHTLNQDTLPDSGVDPMLTLFTAVQEPFPLLFGVDNSLCGRIDRHGSRLFIVDHRAHDAKSFKIAFKISLIHNTSSAGGAGAAAIITSLANLDSKGTARCKSELVGGGSSQASQTTPHSFIFVVKLTSDILSHGPQRRRASTVGSGKGTSKISEASVPAQWFTTLCGANENKTIYIDTCSGGDEPSRDEDSVAGVYYVYVFTLHGFYFEAVCEDDDEDRPTLDQDDSNGDSPLSILTGPEASLGRPLTLKTPGSILYTAGGDNIDDDFQIGSQLDPISASRSAAYNVTTSTTLLRQLLQLRKQRQLRATAQPPPEFVGGSKFTSFRTISSAAGLRAKFLKARAEERRSRLVQNEEGFRSKVLTKLMKVESKRRVMVGSYAERETEQPGEYLTISAPTDSTDLEAKATLMVNFFKEMAVYQPTQRELDEGEHAHIDQEEELLESFADLFHDDHALHNMLDQEKWMSVDEKITRRQSLLDERMKNRRRSLVELNKRQVPQLLDEVDAAGEQESKRKKSAATRASEDYYSTAMLINQLMREIADEERARNESITKDNNERQEKKDTERLRHLAASWGYAVKSTGQIDEMLPQASGPSRGENQDELHNVALVRREDWLSSHHVHDTANNERLRRRHAILRPTLIPTYQPFQQQEEDLPWQPVWEVPVDSEGASRTAGYSHHDAIQQRPRPKTASCAVHSPRPPSSSISRDRSSAVKAAALARNRIHRIQSAQQTNCKERAHVMEDADPVEFLNPGISSELPHSGDHGNAITYVPDAFLRDPFSVVASSPEYFESPTSSSPEIKKLLPQVNAPVACKRSDKPDHEDDDASPPAQFHSLQPRSRRKKKKMTSDEKRFGGRVRELLAISPLLQSFTQADS